MQTHEDRDARTFDWQGLKRRADNMVESRLSEITAGQPNEEVLDTYKHDGMYVTRRPPDRHEILRISLGAGTVGESTKMRYCVYRGDTGACIALLEEALAALRQD